MVSNNYVTLEIRLNNVGFQEGEVARVELYEETANIGKEIFVREEVSVRKEVERETVEAKETLRREELEVDADGDLNIKNK